MAHKYGRRPPKNAPALQFGSFMAGGEVPAHPTSEDWIHNLQNWQMLGNDAVGDCNAVTWANTRRLITHYLSATETYPNQQQVFTFYRTQNPNFDPKGTAQTNGPGSSADQGMDIQTGLEYLHANGGPDGVKVVAFAKVDPANTAEVGAALAIFGTLWLGIIVLADNQTEFSKGEPWTDDHSAVDGGHAIMAGGYAGADAASFDVNFVTWAQETEFAPSFWDGSAGGKPLVEEAWVVIWPEHLGTAAFQQGVNQAQLQADYQDLTGQALALAS